MTAVKNNQSKPKFSLTIRDIGHVMQRLNRFFALALSVVFSLQALAAQDLPDGKYLIVPGNSILRPLPVGFNANGPTSPVIVGGKDNVWRVTPTEGGT
ncbi:hypothetical protein BGZ91_005862, partial [Linnemannia elongata]